MSRVAFIDCQVAGISGDMFLGALLDLGANPDRVVKAIKLIPKFLRGCSGIEVRINKTTRCELKATQVQIVPNEVEGPRTGKEVLDAAIACVKELPISQEAKEFAIKIVRTITEAESKIHGEHPDHTHLHEIGSADTLADAIGSAMACEDLGLIKDCQWFCSPIAVGGGQVVSTHGSMSVPPPAVLEIVKNNNFPIRGGPLDFELTTPTGASIIASLGVMFTNFLPSIRNIRVGYGAGMKNFPNLPNILRIIIGDRETPNGKSYNLVEEMVAVLETNIDDVSGEIIGQTVDVLFEKGAKDVSVIPVVTKKGRPGQIIKVISSLEDAPKLSRILIDETGSLGVRITPTPRLVLKREINTARINIEGKSYEFRLKIARDTSGKIIRMKPEFEDLKKIAKETSLPLRHIIAKVLKNVGKE
ncbi:MAG: nickel pincer cofactor biosynthesis protein LarC [Candidatus Freyarchaeota archaeon]|nr:nickel pincer cofactor biosynthesis protein LarC [Candidatus Jordarchaeia archaeon]MBS7268184.1 nickel pincer cofactor biosynthesis protein LarC [Candidatus Jordarchaeia archaeon]MBS7279443.1 nickel pincer cofactor biosynthesis protein LarC [Candidatus Jordarchaeia archaeon]